MSRYIQRSRGAVYAVRVKMDTRRRHLMDMEMEVLLELAKRYYLSCSSATSKEQVVSMILAEEYGES